MDNEFNRFYTDANEFSGNGVNIIPTEDRTTKNFFTVGTVVKIQKSNELVKIDSVLAVYEKKIYDYKGIVKIDGELRYVYFNHEAISQVISSPTDSIKTESRIK